MLVPVPGQAQGAAERWKGVSAQVAVEVESPYCGEEDLAGIGARFRDSGVSMVVVDCMGFTQPKKELLRLSAGVPVILASSILARFIAEAV